MNVAKTQKSQLMNNKIYRMSCYNAEKTINYPFLVLFALAADCASYDIFHKLSESDNIYLKYLGKTLRYSLSSAIFTGLYRSKVWKVVYY